MATPLPATLIVRKGEVIVASHRLHVGPLEARILWGLAAQLRRRRVHGRQVWRRGPLPIDALVEICYGDDPAGGPDHPEKIIQSKICLLTKALRPLGWEIVADGRNGYLLKETP